ncbi:MAG TPA: isoprenyl transferase [Candidatus Nanopelagicales bacterium]|nr:isoprenyl transferase [Candidatus Nanopelagicales bacterium]
MGWRDVVYGAYERQVLKNLPRESLPRHVAVMLDGNRRRAKARGEGTTTGHQAGADKIEELLEWCREAGVQYVTLWLLSTDNLKRAQDELEPLLKIIETAVSDLADTGNWRLTIVGALDLLPAHTAASLRKSADRTADVDGMTVNVAVGYGGRREIADAVRDLLLARAAAGETIEQIAEGLTADDIASHLYTKGQPDPDLVIRTSGEQRLGGFLLWQSATSEFYFCEAYWPDFRHVDFLRALRAYAGRHRRHGA